MPTENTHSGIELEGRAGVERNEPEGRAQLDAGARGRAPGGRALRQELVDEALDRARRGLEIDELPDEIREQLTDSMIDELLAGRRAEAEILGRGGLLGDLTRRLVERAMAAELTEHLGYPPGPAPPGGAGNARNGTTPKTILTDHGERGVHDVLVCCVDGLTAFPEAIEAVYPQTWVQTCLVHQVRSSLRFVPYRDKQKVAAELKKIYTAVDRDRDHAERELEAFAAKWDERYPMISASWLEH